MTNKYISLTVGYWLVIDFAWLFLLINPSIINMEL